MSLDDRGGFKVRCFGEVDGGHEREKVEAELE